ncbi:MAG: hypothetical protein JXA96_01755 [Sedimentisphaerales bacterium]|nr:hypothetical protein [Sedimentisphaerales bacterium]
MKQKISSLLLIALSLVQVHGNEFQVNLRTSQSQANADIAALPSGGFIVSWSSYFGTSDKSNDIFCRIFEPNCSPVGNEFQINQITTGNQTEPSIAVKTPDEVIVVWQGFGSDEERFDIFAQRIDTNGLPIGDELHVNNMIIENDQICPEIAISNSGSFVIVWESETDPNSTSICCRRFDNNGTALGNEFQVSTDPDSRYPNIAMDPNGNFTVVWIEGNRPNFSIMSRLYDTQGIPVSEPFKVSTNVISSFTQPVIVMDSTGCFFVTWDGDPNLASNDDIHARIYEPNGTPVGKQFVINSTLEKAQQNPQATINDSGQFVVVWDSEGDPNVNEKDILGQRLDKNGNRIGDEFRLNSYTDSDQKCPAVTFIDDGRFITVWQSENQDTSSWGIFGTSQEMISAADFNIDGYINFSDYTTLAIEWHTSEKPYVSDLTNDDKVNGHDLLAFSQNWLNLFNE